MIMYEHHPQYLKWCKRMGYDPKESRDLYRAITKKEPLKVAKLK